MSLRHVPPLLVYLQPVPSSCSQESLRSCEDACSTCSCRPSSSLLCIPMTSVCFPPKRDHQVALLLQRKTVFFFFFSFFFFLLCAFHQTINTGPVVLRPTLAKAYDTTQELSDPIPSSHTGFLFHAMLTTHNCFLPASANSTHCWHCAAVLITNIPNSIMFHRELFIMHIADGCSEFYHASSPIQRCVVEPAALLAQSHALRLWAPSPDDEEQ